MIIKRWKINQRRFKCFKNEIIVINISNYFLQIYRKFVTNNNIKNICYYLIISLKNIIIYLILFI